MRASETLRRPSLGELRFIAIRLGDFVTVARFRFVAVVGGDDVPVTRSTEYDVLRSMGGPRETRWSTPAATWDSLPRSEAEAITRLQAREGSNR